MGVRRWIVVSATTGALFMMAATLVASEARAWRPKKHEFGVGMIGLFGGSGIPKPGSKTHEDAPGVDPVEMPYGGFFGLGGGAGLSLAYNFRGFVGVEMDLLYTRDRGSGEFEVGPMSGDYTIAQWALHIPLLVKGTIPYRTVKPFLFLGPELILPADAEVTYTGEQTLPTTVRATNSAHMAFAFGLGVEFALPVKGADLRIPFTLRGSYYPGVGDTFDDRLSDVRLPPGGETPSHFNFETDFKFQFAATLGVAYYMH